MNIEDIISNYEGKTFDEIFEEKERLLNRLESSKSGREFLKQELSLSESEKEVVKEVLVRVLMLASMNGNLSELGEGKLNEILQR